MANYVVKELPIGMASKEEKRIFPKMQVYTEFDYDKVIELINTYSPSFSKGTVRGVLDTLGVVMASCLPMGHTLKIDGVGVFSLSLQFSDNKEVGETKYRRVEAKGVNFKVDKKLVSQINRENSFEREGYVQPKASAYSRDERLQRALGYIGKHGFITLQDYANLNNLSRSTASRELALFVKTPESGIGIKGTGSHKVWVKTKE